MVHLLTFKISFCSLSVQRWSGLKIKMIKSSGLAPGWANARLPGHAKFANVGTDKVGKCSAVARGVGGGRRGAGRGAVGFDWCILKHAKENLANIQSFWPHAWSIAHVCRFTSPLSFGISDLPTFLTAGHVYSPAPGFILFHKQQVEIFNFSF